MSSPEGKKPLEPLSLKAKILLVLVGVTFGLIALEIGLETLYKPQKGTEFQSINDVRKAMLKADDETFASGETQNVSLREIVNPNPSDTIIYTLRPNLNLRFIRSQVTTNSCGMRGPERSITKPPNTYRIALLGDSFAFGWGVEYQETFAQRLEDNLNRLSTGLKYEVLNFGVPGYSTFQEVALYQELATDFKPDAVLVYFVQNDFGMPFFIRDMDGSGGILSSLQFVAIGRRLLEPDEMDKKIQAMGLDPNRALRTLSKLTSDQGIKLFVAVNPHKAYQEDVKRLWALRKDRSIKLIDIRDQILGVIKDRKIDEKDLTLSFDPHPSPIRHAILGDLLTPYFLSSNDTKK